MPDENLNLWRRLACQTLPKALDISSATAQVAPDLLKALVILSDATVQDLQRFLLAHIEEFS